MSSSLHIDRLVDAYFDGELSPASKQQVDKHVAACARCARLLDQMADLRDRISQLPDSVDPEVDLWPTIENAISSEETAATSRLRDIPLVSLAGLAVAAVLAISLIVLVFVNAPERSWEILRVAGEPAIDSVVLTGQSRVASGQIISTNEESRAAVSVGDIGTVDILPGTTIQVVSATSKHHRFRMDAGTIKASITAPPRLFFVETPSALAIDLGCEYTLHVDSLGRSHLDVSLGYVELEHPGRSSVVPEGYQAVAVPDLGPTVAIDTDASRDFVDLIVAYSLLQRSTALDSLIRRSSERDAVTLWLILERHQPDESDSRRIYDRLVELVGEPEGASFDSTARDRSPISISAWQDHLNLDLTLMSFEAASKKKRLLKRR